MASSKNARLYSRHGDLGETSLLYGPRVGKDHLRIVLFGAIEELNSLLGNALVEDVDSEVRRVLTRLQRLLVVVSVEVSSFEPEKSGVRVVGENQIAVLERAIDYWNARLPVASDAVLPGGSRTGAILHMSRSVCRRAERHATALLRFDSRFSHKVVAWFNRLGDLLYVLARFENNRVDGAEEFLSLKDANDEFDQELI